MCSEKSIKKQKFLIIGTICLLLLIGLIIAIILWPSKEKTKSSDLQKEDTKNQITETYTMIVSINPLVKLVYEQTYTECTDEDGKTYICNEISNEVIAFELQNADAKDIYKDLDFVGDDLYEVLITLCDTARDNDIGFTELTITTDDDKMTTEEISDILKNKSEYKTEFTVNVELKEYIDPAVEGKVKVTFNSNGGTKVSSQILDEGNKASEPDKPTKTGYAFKYWNLNGKKYDFNTKVTEDIFLEAVWEENKKEEQKHENKPGSLVPEPPAPEVPKTEENITPKPVDTTESRIERINLNENIMILHSGGGKGGGCSNGYYVFATNLESLFPGKVTTNWDGSKKITIVTPEDIAYMEEQKTNYGISYDISTYVLESDWLANESSITYDSAKEANLVSVLSSLASNTPPGTTPFRYEFANHKLSYYSFGALAIEQEDVFITLAASLNSIRNDISTKAENASKEMAYISYWSGGCGDMPYPELLNEEICQEYNLVCARW